MSCIPTSSQLRKTVRGFACPSFKRTDGDRTQSISESRGGKVETFCYLPVGHWCMPFSATNLVLLMSAEAQGEFPYRHLVRLGGDLVCDSDLGRGFTQGEG